MAQVNAGIGRNKDKCNPAARRAQAKISGTTFFEDDVTGSANGTVVILHANTGSRPSSPATGFLMYDTTISQMITYTGSGWVNFTGTSV